MGAQNLWETTAMDVPDIMGRPDAALPTVMGSPDRAGLPDIMGARGDSSDMMSGRPFSYDAARPADKRVRFKAAGLPAM